MRIWRGVGIGAGYFSAFHYDAWKRMPGVALQALCDRDLDRAAAKANQFGIERIYQNPVEMLERECPDFVDIITPPTTRLELVAEAAARGIAIICQKPLAPTMDEAEALVQVATNAGARLMVHENFRFQPWHREIHRLLAEKRLGDTLQQISCRTRMGDGWREDAYLARQPYFRQMPRFLLHETGIHFIDTFQFLAGPIVRVFCVTRKLNPHIAGEDCALAIFTFSSGALGLWDGNRYHAPDAADPRYTFGEFSLEGNAGTLRLRPDGIITLQSLDEEEREHPYAPPRHGFAGDCVLATQQHFIDRLEDGRSFETDARVYLDNLRVEEACYESARLGIPVDVSPGEGNR